MAGHQRTRFRPLESILFPSLSQCACPVLHAMSMRTFRSARPAVCACRGFQFTNLDTKYARLLRKSHPGSRLALLTDMDTQFDFAGVNDIEVGVRAHALPTVPSTCHCCV